MTASELAMWRTTATRHPGARDGGWVASPCDDCTLGFALEMRAEGRCNGTPGGVEEDEPLAREGLTMATTIEARVTTPCERCIHAVVCGRRAAIADLAMVPVEAETLPAGLTLVLAAEIDCDAFMPTVAAAKPKRVYSPEGLEKMRESGRQLAERRRLGLVG